jgi:C1A family cysteine protease
VTYPAAFDLRTVTDKLSAVRDQGPDGNCWAFAALGSLESYLRPTDPFDFSEDNLAVAAGTDFDYGLYDGGNYNMATAELSRWNGPVAEASDAYGDGVFVSGLAPLAHVQNVLFLPDRAGPTDNDTIKWALENEGPVYTAMYADSGMESSKNSAAFNTATDAFCYSGTADANHAVDIVGWDDAYSASNFSTPPAGNGAFIVRNSWTTGWGQGGYFYVSYYDTRFATQLAVFTGETAASSAYTQNFGYDKLGMTTDWGYGDTTAWMAAAFMPTIATPLKAAAFYAQSPETTYDIYVGTSPSDHSASDLVATGTIDVPGYRTVAFDTQPTVAAGSRFYVIVRLTTPGEPYPIPIEYAEYGYSSGVTAAAHESYTSADGLTWDDLGDAYGADVCLKAFGGAAADPYAPATRALAAVTVKRGAYATLRYRVNDQTTGDKEKVTIRLRTTAGPTVKTLALGWRAANTSLTYKFRCLVSRGGYRYYVYATDRWGNAQTSIGRALLTVK